MHAAAGRRSISTEWNILCDSDFPTGDYDAVLLPLAQQFSDEYIRDLTLSAFHCLQIGGTLTIGSPQIKDYEYHKFLKSLFNKVTRIVSDTGIIYQGKKLQALVDKRISWKRPQRVKVRTCCMPILSLASSATVARTRVPVP